MSKDPRATSEWRRARRIALKTKDWVCYICGNEIPRHTTLPDLKVEVDHIIAIAYGGAPFDQSNLALTHRFCNRSKGKKLPSENNGVRKKVEFKEKSEKPINSDYLKWIGGSGE